ncbi:MAG: xanthine dehydrogenase family protein molybdopterin-binding subunit [Hyphomicrobiales bacterium]|nr:MAG: xanthine dehydrogenase family protein molybdopterin-binding subunit [Hyphomicrobiales bacterium]
MGRAAKIARRSFLIGSAAIAGGVAFGAYLVKRNPDNPLKTSLAKGETTFNPWVKIDANRITLITPHADKGQGVASMQAALIAEELDLEPGQYEIAFGAPSAAYWNTALAADAMPFAPSDTSFIAETARSAGSALFKVLGLQITGGSSAAPDSFDKLRIAGAVARETLKLAASRQTGIPVERLRTEKGAVLLPDGKALRYTELAAAASQIEPVTNVVLRPASQWRVLGKSMQRLDIVAKSTGTLTYGIDIKVPGMVYAAVRSNPRQGGKLLRYDAAPASAMRGVQKVVPITNGVAVIADNTWRAMKAVEAIACEWGPAPYPADQAEHWRAVESAFKDAHLDKAWHDKGQVEKSFAAGTVVTAEYRSPYVAHQPLEPLNATVRVTDAAVEVWTGHQIPRIAQQIVARITGHKPEQVVLHNQFIGGSFGHRLEFDWLKQATEIANQLRGVPVKLTFSREEDFAHDFPRPLAIGRARGTVSQGQIETIDLQIASPSVTASQMGRAGIPVMGPDPQIAAGAWTTPYAIANFRLRAYKVPELAPVSSWRSVGAAAGGFILESFVDELIHAAGADPLKERMRLTPDPVARKVLEAVGEMSAWGSALEAGRARGIAFVESFGVPVAEIVEVSTSPKGIRIEKVWIACEVGRVLDPVNFENLVQGGVVFGLGHAMNCAITFADGKAEQTNFDAHEGMRLNQCPQIFVKGLENGSKVRGIGEPPVPPTAPALANAIFAATGKRLRALPFHKQVKFV